jgi:hypothetical protein
MRHVLHWPPIVYSGSQLFLCGHGSMWTEAMPLSPALQKHAGWHTACLSLPSWRATGHADTCHVDGMMRVPVGLRQGNEFVPKRYVARLTAWRGPSAGQRCSWKGAP